MKSSPKTECMNGFRDKPDEAPNYKWELRFHAFLLDELNILYCTIDKAANAVRWNLPLERKATKERR